MCEDSSLPRVIKTSFLDVLDFNVFMNKKGFRIYVGQSFIRPQSSFKLPLVFDHYHSPIKVSNDTESSSNWATSDFFATYIKLV